MLIARHTDMYRIELLLFQKLRALRVNRGLRPLLFCSLLIFFLQICDGHYLKIHLLCQAFQCLHMGKAHSADTDHSYSCHVFSSCLPEHI